MTSPWPITLDDVHAARERLRPYLSPSPLRRYPLLDTLVGHGIAVYVKHENHLPVQTFKVRNGLSAVTALDDAARGRGVIGASTGNHGQGMAYAAHLLGIPCTIVVPVGNNPEKNAAIRALGAELVEHGATYDDSARRCAELSAERGMTLIHGINDRTVIAGAATMTLEMLEQEPGLDAIFIALGGGSQAVGAMTVTRALKPSARVIAVQSEAAPAQYESWRRGEIVRGVPVRTFAEGIATGQAYDMTFPALKAGLADFITVSEAELADSLRELVRTTHNLPEGAAAGGLAGLRRLAPTLAGQKVAIVMCGGNISLEALKTVLSG
ncbi:MAG: threonine/serine dehydratase [Gemmatimonadetes bacterium]|nr:threonine/serine dehydratase [Gemmatimonadota bacterium]